MQIKKRVNMQVKKIEKFFRRYNIDENEYIMRLNKINDGEIHNP